MPSLWPFSHLVARRPAVRATNLDIPAGNTIANTTDETAFASLATIPAGALNVGAPVRMHLSGVYSAGIAQALTAKIKLGSVVLLNTGSLNGIANGSNLAWMAEVSLLPLAVGVNGGIDVSAAIRFATAATAALSVNMQSVSPVTVDTTGAADLTVTIGWAAASASNSITLRQFDVRW